MKNVSLSLTAFIILFQFSSYATTTFEVTLENDIVISDSIVNPSCIGDCDGKIFITYEVGNPDFTPTSFLWKNENYEIIEGQKDVSYLCPGDYSLTVSFQNGKDSTLHYTILQSDDDSPTINLSAISYSLAQSFDDGDLGASIEIIGDSLIAVGVTCVYGESDIDNILYSEFSLSDYAIDNCDLDLQETSSYIPYDEEYYQNEAYSDYITSTEYFVSDNSGNMDSVEILFYTAVYYQPIIDLLEVEDENGIKTPYTIEYGSVSKPIVIDQKEVYSISAQVDPVCSGYSTYMNWDIDNDGLSDAEGSLHNFSDSAGIFNITGKAFAETTQNTISTEISFTVNVLGFNIWETIYPSECGTDCNGDILIDYEYFGDDYEPQNFIWKDVDSGEIIGNTADLYDTCAGNYELTVDFFGLIDSYKEQYSIGETDTNAPVFNIDSLTKYLESTKLNASINMVIEPFGDTLLIDVSCYNNSSDVDNIFNNLIRDFDLFTQDECDGELDIWANETVLSEDSFTDFISKNVVGSWYFLASKKISIVDDSGNQSTKILIVYISDANTHSPIFNQIISSFNDGESKEFAVSDGFELDEGTIELPFEENIVLIADTDPVCTANTLEVRWDLGDNGLAEGDSINLPFTLPGAYSLSVQAFGTVINNAQSGDLQIDLALNGVDVDYQINLDCENECKNEVTATVNSFGSDYIEDRVEWLDLDENVISNATIATGLCAEDYVFRVYFTSGIIYTDTVEMNITVISAKKDVTCVGDKDGSLAIEAVKGFDDYSISWKDSNNILIGEDDKIENLAPGMYTLEIITSDSNCPYVEEFEIMEGLSFPTALFTFEIAEENQIKIRNNSQDATSFQWDFGDNSSSETVEEEFTHLYQSGGQYELLLIASNANGCSDTLTVPVEIEVTGLKEIEQAGINIFPNPVSQKILNVQIEEKINKGDKLVIMDANGSNIKTHIVIDQDTQLNLRDLSDGMYFLLAEMDGAFYKKKILVISD